MQTKRPLLLTAVLVAVLVLGGFLLAGPAAAAAPVLAEPMLEGVDNLALVLSAIGVFGGAALIGYAVWPAPEPVRSEDA